MTRHPTPNQLDALLDAIRIDHRRAVHATLTAAIERDQRGGGTTPTGYPSSTLGGSGGNNELTSVEAAATARPNRDRLRENITEAIGYLEQAVASIHAFTNRVDNLRTLAGLDPPPRCELCLDDQAHFSDVGGRLPRAYRLCTSDYDYARTHDRVRTPDEVEERRRYGASNRRTRA